ncbi:hypothetical protein ACFL0D_04835 [Thermoproteota archaeon]
MEEYVVVTKVFINRFYLVKADSAEEAKEKWWWHLMDMLKHDAVYIENIPEDDDEEFIEVVSRRDIAYDDILERYVKTGHRPPTSIG